MHVKNILFGLVTLFLSACLGMPEKVEPVSDFELNRYLGKWYEIARLNHSFERGLSQVTANYSLKDDGGVRVVNRGYSEEDSKWKQSEGKAYFVDKTNEGYLKVSFFGPFYGAYVVFELDKENYQHAFVSGPNTKYLWLLARTPSVEPELIDKFARMAEARGFKSEDLIYVKHEKKE